MTMQRRALCFRAAAFGLGAGIPAARADEPRGSESNPADAPKRFEAALGDPDLQGVSDIHIHASPDSKPRCATEIEVAEDAQRAGYRAVLFKSNDFSSHDRAFHLRRMVPGIEVFGGLVLNRATGERVNVHAVEKAIATSGGLCRIVWLPTLDAEYAVRCSRERRPFIPVSSGGKLLPEVLRVIELCAQADIALATGHSSPEESLLVAQAAKAAGLRKLIVTHPNTLIWKMSPAELERAASLGAWIECCYLGRLWGPSTGLPMFERESRDAFNSFMRVVPERTFLSTDLGQVGLPHPIDGMKRAIAEMRELGISDSAVDLHVRRIPAMLLGLKV